MENSLELNQILDNISTKKLGELKDENHDLVRFIKKNRGKFKNSKINGSFIKDKLEWKEYNKGEDDIYLLRITNIKILNDIQDLIRDEYRLQQEKEDLTTICPEFICYYFSNILNFSLFKFTSYLTFEEILSDEKKLKDFNVKNLLLYLSNTINQLNNFDGKYYINPYLHPSKLLITKDSKNSEYFYLAEIFISSNSIDEKVKVKLRYTN